MVKAKARSVGVVFSFFAALLLTMGQAVGSETPEKIPPYPNGYVMLGDMELVALLPPSTNAKIESFDFDADMNVRSSGFVGHGVYSHSNGSMPLIEKGRMHVSDHDEMFVLYWSVSDNSIYLKVYDEKEKKEYGPYCVVCGVTLYKRGNVETIMVTMAVGDIDNDNKDEAVIAYRHIGNTATRQSYTSSVTIKVFKWDGSSIEYSGFGEVGGIMKLLIGDFNGDAKNELLFLTQYPGPYGNQNSDYQATFFKLSDHQLSEIKRVRFSSPYDNTLGCWSVALVCGTHVVAGDIDGDSSDEIAMVNSVWYVGVVDFESDLSVKSVRFSKSSNSNTDVVSGLKIAIADLNGDGKKEIVSTRWNDSLPLLPSKKGFVFRVYGPKGGGSLDMLTMKVLPTAGDSVFCDMTAGDLDGRVATGEDRFDEEIAFVAGDIGASILILDKESFFNPSPVVTPRSSVSCGQFQSVKNIIAADLDGDSLVLGTPEIYGIEDHLDYTAIVAEPPKHLDFVKDINGEWRELNVSRIIGVPGIEEAFYAEFKDKAGNAITITDKHSTDQNFSVGLKTDVSNKWSFLGVSVKGYADAAAGYSFNHKKSEWNESYSSVEMANDVRALDDDYLLYRSQNIYLWIYPVLGKNNEQADNGERGQLFIEVSRPGPFKKRFVPGKMVEWYQPVHENGNLFSYPWAEEQMEGFDPSNLKTERTTIGLGGGDVEEEVVWSESSENGTETSWTHKMNFDLTLGFKAKVYSLKFGASVHTHYDEAWTHLHTSVSETSLSKGITVATCPVNVNYAYAFSPYIYAHNALGCLDLNYTVDLAYGTSGEWWQNLSGYGSNPDLALNLPWRWVAYKDEDTDKWKFKFNEGAEDLKKSKSIFFVGEDGKPFGYVVKAGKKVKVKARVYNYSFVPVSQGVTVRFEYQKGQNKRVWDDKEKRWVYKMVWGDRIKVEDVTISPIPAYQNPQNTPNWEWAETTFDTTGLEGNYLRFWVTVDPDNEITEIYGHDNGDKYDNNEGYSSVNLAVVSDDDLAKLNVMPGESKRDQTYRVGGVENDLVMDEVRFSDETPQEGETVDVTARIRAEGANFSHVTVYFYDDDPEKGGSERPFDVEMIPVLRDGESYEVRVKYRTEDKGGKTVKIYAEVEARRGEKSVENNVDLGEIYVREANGSWRDEVIGRLRN